MARRVSALCTTLLKVLVFSTPAFADAYQIYDSRDALAAEISSRMADGDFSNLVASLSPETQAAIGRVRILEEAYGDAIPAFNDSVPLFVSGDQETVHREVRAWWSGETYVFVGTLTHEQQAGVVVLDFLLTGDVRRASSWFLAGNPE